MELNNAILKKLFENVYFINGTAYAGKSTMVKMLSEKYDGICCGENYNEKLFSLIDPEHQPCLCYFDTMSGWPEFLGRTPEAYDAWIEGCSREGTDLEIIELIRCTAAGRLVFVDTNISLEALREISDYRHVAIMLSDQSVSVNRFFERPDREKQFLYQRLLEMPDPEAALANFRRCLEKINSPERYRAFEESGFFVLKRDESRTPEETMAILAQHFGLEK